MTRFFACACALACLAAGCNGSDHTAAMDAGGSGGDAGTIPGRKPMTLAEARDPMKCMKCHPNHYTEWASSMHAYASQDPVFIAMNKRGQRETNGQLGDFCVKCHAPMAVLEGKTTDGLNLDQVDPALKGVTCYFCHNAVSVEGDHNNMVKLANDVTMRGPIQKPKQPVVHVAAHSDLLDEGSLTSNMLCGGCHDIVTPAGVHLERTFEEYRESTFSKGMGRQTCANCHMDEHENELAADDPPSHVGTRTTHEHLWPGVDLALTDFPDKEAQRQAILCNLSGGSLTYSFDIETNLQSGTPEPGSFPVSIETQAGHRQPSGAAQDRRMWFEFLAYDSNDTLLSQSSGHIADDELEEKPADDPKHDPQLWLFRDRIFDENGQPTHMFWQAAPSGQYMNGYAEPVQTLPTTVDPTLPHYVSKTYRVPPTGTKPGQTARITAHMRIRPMGMDVLQDLVDSGDLDPAVKAQMPTFTMFGTEIQWKLSDGTLGVKPKPDTLDCPNSYLCLLRPGSSYCDSMQ